MKVVCDIKLSKSQREAWMMVNTPKSKKAYFTFAWSRQSGKTTLMEIFCFRWLTFLGVNIAYVCRNYILAKKLYREIVRIMPKEMIKTANGSDLFIESVFGSTLNFFSAESGAALRGQSFHYLICDEFAFHKQEQPDGTHLWNDILSPTMKAKGRVCIFVSTPLGKNNIFYDMYMRGLSDEYPNYYSLKKTIYDDGFIDEQGIEEIRKGIPEISFKQEYLCEFLDDSLSFFQGYSNCFDIDKYDDGERCWIGVDLSGDGEDSTILTKINKSGQVKQYVISGTLDMKYREIASIIDSSNPIACYLEKNGIGAPMVNEIKKLSKLKARIYEWSTNNTSKEEIITDLAMGIVNREVHFEKDNRRLYTELGDFAVSISKSRKMTFASAHGHDDTVMSLAIALRARKDIQASLSKGIGFINSNNRWLK